MNSALIAACKIFKTAVTSCSSPPGCTWKLFSSYIFFHFFSSKTITNWVNKTEKYNIWRERWAAEQISKPLLSRWPCSLLPLCAPHSFDSSAVPFSSWISLSRFHLDLARRRAGVTVQLPQRLRKRNNAICISFFFPQWQQCFCLVITLSYTELCCLHSQLRDMLNTHFPANLEDWRRNGKISLKFSVSCKCFRWLNKWVLISIFWYSTRLFIF